MALFNYECDETKRIIDEVSPNYPQLTTYEKEWIFFHKYHYIPGIPVELEYQKVNVNPYGSVANAIPYHYKSAILKGQTLVNLAQSTNLNGEYVFRDNFELLSFPCNMIKPSTTYTIISNIIENSANFLYLEWNTDIDECAFKEIVRIDGDGSLGIRKFKVTSKDDLSNASKSIRFFPNNKQENGTLTITFMILEGDYTNIDIPYFEGMQSAKMPVLTTTGKNLFDKEAFYNDWKSKEETYVYKESVDDEEVLKIYNRDLLFSDSKGFKISVKKDVPLTISFKCKKAGTLDTKAIFSVRHNNTSFKDVGRCNSYEWTQVSESFIPTRDYITVCSAYEIEDYFYIKDIQLEYGEQLTTYETYKSNILTVNEDLTLRSNGDICDELNLLTGQLTQRIDENNEVLSQEILKTVNMNKLNKPYEGTNHYHLTSNIPCEAIIEVPVVSTGKQTLKEIND